MQLSYKLLRPGYLYVRERLKPTLMKFYGRCGDLIKQYEVLSRFLHDIQEHDRMQWRPSLIRNYTNSRPCYRSGPYCWVWPFYQIPKGFHRIFTLVAACEHISHLLLLIPGPVPFRTCICSNVKSCLSKTYLFYLEWTNFCIDQLVTTVIKWATPHIMCEACDWSTLSFRILPQFLCCSVHMSHFISKCSQLYRYGRGMHIFGVAETFQ